jgi:AcrR family transcriptional regulator
MGRPVNADGRQTREAVLDAALELFSERGYFGTSLRDIATAVGVRESALYNYFPSKAHLFDALVMSAATERAGQLTALFEAPIVDARLTLSRLAAEALEHFCLPQEERRFRVLMADGLRLARAGRINLLDRMSAGRTQVRQLMQRLIREGWLRPADPDVLAMAFFGPLLWWRTLHAAGAGNRWVTGRARFVRAHVKQFLHGAAVRTPARTGRQAPSRRTARRPGSRSSRTNRAAADK